jgi:4'-phosphopantetheinyl transferase
MPLFKIESTGTESGWAIWFIEESEQELAFMASEQCPEEIISLQKRLEWLAGRVLIKKLVEHHGLTYLGIHKDEFGKPFLRDLSHHISLSHSYPHVAAQLDLNQSVGIDLEQPKEKLLSIAHRVLSPIELNSAANDLKKNCVYWCAKEALYKIYGKRGLHFSNQLNIEPFEMSLAGLLKGTITVKEQKQSVDLIYRIERDCILVYTKTIQNK